ncbi:MAG: glycosyltransferase [Pseudomonadota bacterium]|nr:glycosyltransferase [Pseudomonadota bacterium]
MPSAKYARVSAAGKFLFAGGEKLFVRGVSYGTFRPGADGNEHHPAVVGRDFATMAAHGINAVRLYTVPPLWLLDAAAAHGLRVMVGLPWEQHVDFLADTGRARAIVERVGEGVRACADHPAVLCYAVGNEIPTAMVRWLGAARVEAFLERLYAAAKEADPGALVTYVNYPSTEYLRLDAFDLLAFNVYLEADGPLQRYLARLQNLAGDRPLILAEIGLDSRRNGVEAQADTLAGQLRTTFARGAAGTFVFGWTDEWHRGGHDVDDWDFGLTTRDRQPKPALAAIRQVYAELPFGPDVPVPRISVVVCTYNGARTLKDCLDGLLALDYPDHEVIVVDDGSTDHTAAIAAGYPFRLIRTTNHGLSSARNTGLAAATGTIVAYTDDDARPDPHWLTYLAATFRETDHAAVGGPNLPPPEDGAIADCVANAPGGPVHVLLTDELAEHIPGCNMAFRVEHLRAIGGFDIRYRTAGDDVDVCWRLQARGWTLGFNPAAVVWHHRRGSVRTYWKQQRGYGAAEALLEGKWPERYNAAGHLTWAGRLYGHGAPPLARGSIYQGIWGTAPYQSVYTPAAGAFTSLPQTPEWWLLVSGLCALALLGFSWPPLLLAAPLAVAAIAAPVAQAARAGARARFPPRPRTWLERVAVHALTALLHLLQPMARLRGRLLYGLTPWRKPIPAGAWPGPALTLTLWTEQARPPEAWLAAVEARLRAGGVVVRAGGAFDRWDLEVQGGTLGGARMLLGLEDHGAGKQLARFRASPTLAWAALCVPVLLGLGAAAALADGAWVAAVALGWAGLVVAVRAAGEVGAGLHALRSALRVEG